MPTSDSDIGPIISRILPASRMRSTYTEDVLGSLVSKLFSAVSTAESPDKAIIVINGHFLHVLALEILILEVRDASSVLKVTS